MTLLVLPAVWCIDVKLNQDQQLNLPQIIKREPRATQHPLQTSQGTAECPPDVHHTTAERQPRYTRLPPEVHQTSTTPQLSIHQTAPKCPPDLDMSLSGAAAVGPPWKNHSFILGGSRDPPLSDQGETIIGVYLLLLGTNTSVSLISGGLPAAR